MIEGLRRTASVLLRAQRTSGLLPKELLFERGRSIAPTLASLNLAELAQLAPTMSPPCVNHRLPQSGYPKKSPSKFTRVTWRIWAGIDREPCQVSPKVRIR